MALGINEMSLKTVYLITGANRGIGFHLVSRLLTRPNTTVVATVRSSTTDKTALQALNKDPTSNLVISYLSTDEIKTPAALLGSLTKEYDVKHIDVIVVNAANSSFESTLEESMKSIKESFEINTFLPISVFQTFHPLLAKSTTPKFIYISSVIGSIEELKNHGTFPVLAYGAAKAAANFFVRKVHFEFPGFVSLIIHPGWIKTEMGHKFADSIGFAEGPPHNLDDCVGNLLQRIDEATRETTSGTFVRWDGDAVSY